MKENVILNKSFDFAVRIVNLYKYLTIEKKELSYPSKFYEVEPLLGH